MLKDKYSGRRSGKRCMTTLHAKLPRVLMATFIMGAVLKIRVPHVRLVFLYREAICFELRPSDGTSDFSASFAFAFHPCHQP